MTVWKAATKMADPKNMGIFGTSAGGALTLEMVLRAKQDGLALPAAIAAGTPMSDVTNVGDSFETNKLVDNVLVSPDGFCDAAAKFYAHGHDMADPLLSPVYGDMHGFPPAILTSGTRDLLLSNTVRVHRKLRQAGVEAVLQVFEGQSHAQYYRDVTAPETKDVSLFVEGPTPDWALPVPKLVEHSPPGVKRFAFELDGLPPGVSADGAALKLTLVGGDRAYEFNVNLN